MDSKYFDNSADFCEMLPWYVNGTLSDTESQAMEKHLLSCKQCDEERLVLGSLQTSLGKETVAVLTPTPNTEQFLAQLDTSSGRRLTKRMTWVAGAIAASVGIFAVVMSNYFSEQSSTELPTESLTDATRYETVVESDSSATFDYVLLVSLDRQIEVEEQRAVLQTLDPVSIADVASNGDYRVVVRLPARSVEELERFRQHVESNSAIIKASIVAIELPMESK